MSWELCDINMVRIPLSIFDAKWCSDRIKILSSFLFFPSYFNSTESRLTMTEKMFAIILNYDSINTPYPKVSHRIFISRRGTTKWEEKRNESKNTSLQKLLLQKSLSSFCGENLWCLICNKFDDYNLIKYKEFKFKRIFIFPAFLCEILY